jgi:hypothetical protein
MKKNNEKFKLTVKDGNSMIALQSNLQNANNCCDPCECGIPGCDCSDSCC